MNTIRLLIALVCLVFDSRSLVHGTQNQPSTSPGSFSKKRQLSSDDASEDVGYPPAKRVSEGSPTAMQRLTYLEKQMQIIQDQIEALKEEVNNIQQGSPSSSEDNDDAAEEEEEELDPEDYEDDGVVDNYGYSGSDPSSQDYSQKNRVVVGTQGAQDNRGDKKVHQVSIQPHQSGILRNVAQDSTADTSRGNHPQEARYWLNTVDLNDNRNQQQANGGSRPLQPGNAGQEQWRVSTPSQAASDRSYIGPVYSNLNVAQGSTRNLLDFRNTG